MSGEQDLLYFNGIRGESGQYDLDPMPPEQLLQLIKESGEADILAELQLRYRQRMSSYLGVKGGIDAARLDQAGWGIIFAHDADPAIVESLQEMLEFRSRQAGRLFKVYQGSAGYRPGESKNEFLKRHGAGPGPADPYYVPYYLLIVGSPQDIPYRFQAELGVQYGVGRIHFETIEAYANYARTVTLAEKGAFDLPQSAAFFAITNDGDPATRLSRSFLVEPLLKQLQSTLTGWNLWEVADEQATKQNLIQLLTGRSRPALLFATGHGMIFSAGNPRRQVDQGALLCADWPGPPAGQGVIQPDQYFSASDLEPSASLQGMIAFFTSSYGVGTPAVDRLGSPGDQPMPGRPSVARLPAAMLSLERGGALAVIGQLGRALSYSFRWSGFSAQTTTFESAIRGLLSGLPVGYAMEYFKDRYAELSTELSAELRNVMYLDLNVRDPGRLIGNWTAGQDAGSYIIFGDPAVRLAVPNIQRAW